MASAFLIFLTLWHIINCQDKEIILYMDPFLYPNETYPFSWFIEEYHGINWCKREYFCARYFGSGHCINILPKSIISRVIPTTGYHSLRVQIGMYTIILCTIRSCTWQSCALILLVDNC